MVHQDGIPISQDAIEAIVSVVHGLVIGLSIAVLYAIVLFWKQRKIPATGTWLRIVVETAVIWGAVRVFWRLVHFEYLHKLNGEEHLFIALGCLALVFIMLKEILHIFLAGLSQHPPGWQPHTGQD
ncbi:MAG TPA: hypothetical protein VJ806_00440 [Luteimonas sp.]|nr:hypothetical protein [Luteimonas sp.]